MRVPAISEMARFQIPLKFFAGMRTTSHPVIGHSRRILLGVGSNAVRKPSRRYPVLKEFSISQFGRGSFGPGRSEIACARATHGIGACAVRADPGWTLKFFLTYEAFA
jgi:hypothetical protein